MKTYIYNSNRGNSIYIKFDLIEVKKIIGYYDFSEREVNFKEIGNVIKGFELLGRKVKSIKTGLGLYIDLDKKYYHKYPDDFINRLYRRTNYSIDVIYKNNRLYTIFEDKEVILPKNIYDSCSYPDCTLSLNFELEEL